MFDGVTTKLSLDLRSNAMPVILEVHFPVPFTGLIPDPILRLTPLAIVFLKRELKLPSEYEELGSGEEDLLAPVRALDGVRDSFPRYAEAFRIGLSF